MLPPCDFERMEIESKLSRPPYTGTRHGELSAHEPHVAVSFYREFSTPIVYDLFLHWHIVPVKPFVEKTLLLFDGHSRRKRRHHHASGGFMHPDAHKKALLAGLGHHAGMDHGGDFR